MLQRSTKLQDLPESHYHLAEAYLLKKLPSDAKRSLKRAEEAVEKRLEKGLPFDTELRRRIADANQRADRLLENESKK
ncbi:MAG: hypothetical protein QM813_05995 [Verrucomicrobiota bacterium]